MGRVYLRALTERPGRFTRDTALPEMRSRLDHFVLDADHLSEYRRIHHA